MPIINPKRITELAVILFGIIISAVTLWTASKGKKYPLRRLDAIEAISDCIDRAVEMGKPAYITPGCRCELSGTYAPMTIAGLNICRYTARIAVERGADAVIVCPPRAAIVPLLDGIYREVCIAAGKPDAYNPDNVLYFGNQLGQYAVGMQGVIAERGSAFLLVAGAWTNDCDLTGEAYNHDAGGLNLGGTPRFHHLGSTWMIQDYPLYGEDVYGAGAYCSDDETVMSSLFAGDALKVGMVALIFIALIAYAATGTSIIG